MTIRAVKVIKMLVFSVLILCCMFIFHRNTNESEALLVYDPRYRYYNQAGRTYGRYYVQGSYEIHLDTKATKKPSHKPKVKSQPPINLSFEPLGALKIDSLTRGQIEIHPDKISDALLSLASGAISTIPNVYQYIPSLPSFYGDEEPAQASSEDRLSHPRKHHHRNSDQDQSGEDDETKETSKPHNGGSGQEDHSEKPSKYDNSDEEKSDHETPKHRNDDDDDNAAEEHDKIFKESSKEHKNSKEGLKEPEPVLEPEIPIEEMLQEGYVDKFIKYYSYAKPVVKAASLFVPGLGQYRAAMLGIEMADLAYNVASIYSKGDGYLSMGYLLGKEAFKRLGRRNEPRPDLQDSRTNTPSEDSDVFLGIVKNTRYPLLDDEKEQQIKTSVANIVYKYCHNQEQYQNETERAKFIDLMVSCVKFIALYEILPAA